MKAEFRELLRDLDNERRQLPDCIVVVLDANCIGHTERKQEIDKVVESYPRFQPLVHCAIPDPHIERWMLVDPDAFRRVFGKGCTLPARKCAKDEYKKLLRKEIRASGREPILGGEEYAEPVVEAMDLNRAERREPSIRLFLRELRAIFAQWVQR